MTLKNILSVACVGLLITACQGEPRPGSNSQDAPTLTVGAERFDAYLPLIEGKSIAVVANATSRAQDQHLVDALLERDIQVRKVFAPEHGFRGEKDAGEIVKDEHDAKTGLPIYSLYGRQKKPTPEMLNGVDAMVFDIQDVGVRFYTYLSTLHYIMESCAENNVPLVLLDRPNPNGFYIDGPVLKPEFASFVGLHPVPLVYGMTIGEYGQMINGEGWLNNGATCDLTVVKLEGYDRNSSYDLPVKPSPNLPNATSVYLYPSLALFEGTVVSIGRGTDFPFQVVGHPDYKDGDFTFTPKPVAGAMTPKLEGELCRGFDLRAKKPAIISTDSQIDLERVINFYQKLPNKDEFFLPGNFFNKLAGNSALMRQIKAGESAEDIRNSWQEDLNDFKEIRRKYLLYK